MSFRHEAIYKLYPEVVTSIDNKSYDSSGVLVNVDEAKVTKETDKLQAEYDSKKYQRERLAEYPSIQELVVALYDESDKASIIERRNAVKAKYPKPE